jgi:serine/threonine protein phosphatase PrpC
MPGHTGNENPDIRTRTMPNVPGQSADLHWRVIGRSVQGRSHITKNLDNQDAIDWLPQTGAAGRVALSVADGHGSPKNFRSRVGARLAVDVSLQMASELLNVPDDPVPDRARLLSFVKDRLEQDVPRRVVREWLKRVDEDLSRSPLSAAELDRLEAADGHASRDLVTGNPRLAYGSTLVTAIAMESFMAFWQIGDGDVLTVSAAGNVSRPLPNDDRLIANETTSLCSADASRQFRVAVLGTPVPMVLVSTDGFSNSFQDDEGMFKFGSDVREIINREGLTSVAERLEGWLTEMTSRGSGDDISLGIVCRSEGPGPEHHPTGRSFGAGQPETIRKPPEAHSRPGPGPGIADGDHETVILASPGANPDASFDADDAESAGPGAAGPDPAAHAKVDIRPSGPVQIDQGGKRSSWWWPAAWWRGWRRLLHRRNSRSSGVRLDKPADEPSETN